MFHGVLDNIPDTYQYQSKFECVCVDIIPFFVSPNKCHPAPPRRFQHCSKLCSFVACACICVSIECSVISSVGVCVYGIRYPSKIR